jgi:hypothetical protein
MLALHHLGEISALVLDVIFQTLQPPASSSPAVMQGDAHRGAVSHTCAEHGGANDEKSQRVHVLLQGRVTLG